MDAGAVPLLRRAVDGPSTRIVAVDGGALRLLTQGIVPQVVTGDFDSLTEEILVSLEAQGATILPTPDQDYTDLDKALTYVRNEIGDLPIEIFGATGGRLDHTYSVLSAIIKHGVFGEADIRLIDEIGETRPVRAGRMQRVGDDLPGRVLSLITIGTVRNITLHGVQWELEDATLAPGVRDGTLNQITERTVRLSCEIGAPLLVQIHHAPAPVRQTARG